MRVHALAIVAVVGAVAGSTRAAPPTEGPVTFPSVTSSDLTGRKLTLPRDLSDGRTILILAFTRPQQAQVEGWIRGLALQASEQNWLELPVIAQPGPLMRLFIDNGMRRGITDVAVRRHVVTLYTDKRALLERIGVTSEADVIVLVVDHDGRVHARASGAFTQVEGRRILKATQ